MIPAVRILCCTGFTSYFHWIILAEDRSCCTIFSNLMKAALYQADKSILYIQLAQKLWLELLHHVAINIYNTVYQIWLKAFAVSRNLSHNRSCLYRSYQIEPLPYSCVKGFCQVPILFKNPLFVSLAGHQPLRLIRQINTGKLAHAKHPGITLNNINSQTIAHFIEIHIIRMSHSLFKIQPAQSLSASITLRYNPVMTRVENLFLWCHLTLRQSRCTCNNLKGRTWWIFTCNSLVIHWIIRIIVNNSPILARNTINKEIWIKSRTTDNSQHLSRLRIQSHRCCCMGTNLNELFINSLLCCCLYIQIYG